MKNIFVLLTFIITLNCYAQEKKCAEFKTGKFRYVGKNMSEKIVRTDSIQTEINEQDGISIKTAVEWKSECEYVLTYIEILNYDKDVNEILGKKIYCEIIETNEKRFKVHVKSTTVNDIVEFEKIYY